MIKIENITPRKNVVKYETQKVIIPQQPFTEPTEIKQKMIIVREPFYTTSDHEIIIVKDVDECKIVLNSAKIDNVTIKSLTKVSIKPDLGEIDEFWEEIIIDKGACVNFRFMEGNWYIISSDGVKLN
jgi:hypothetical protein